MSYANEATQEVNPYEVTHEGREVPNFFFRKIVSAYFFFHNIVSAYLLRLQVEIRLWLLAAVAAGVPLFEWRIHVTANLPMSTFYEPVLKSLFLLVIALFVTQYFWGRKIMNQILTHFIVTFVAYVVVIYLILLGAVIFALG